MWVEAVALIAIFVLDWRERRDARIERAEQRKAREDERLERQELRAERKRLQEDRQREEVTCLGVQPFASAASNELVCNNLWKHTTNSQPGFAIDQQLRINLPEYLQRKADSHSVTAMTGGNRYLMVFKFPYREHAAILDDLREGNFGERAIAWDGEGKPIKI